MAETIDGGRVGVGVGRGYEEMSLDCPVQWVGIGWEGGREGYGGRKGGR